jgi:hypothetical protein
MVTRGLTAVICIFCANAWGDSGPELAAIVVTATRGAGSRMDLPGRKCAGRIRSRSESLEVQRICPAS